MTLADMLIRKCTDHVTDGSARPANRTHVRMLFTRKRDFPWASRHSVDCLASVSFFLVESEPSPPQVQEQRGPRIVVQARMPEVGPASNWPCTGTIAGRIFARIQSAAPTHY